MSQPVIAKATLPEMAKMLRIHPEKPERILLDAEYDERGLLRATVIGVNDFCTAVEQQAATVEAVLRERTDTPDGPMTTDKAITLTLPVAK